MDAPDLSTCCFGENGRSSAPLIVLSIDGEDLTGKSLLARERRLRAIMPRIESRIQYVDHVRGRGAELFDRICRNDCEGIVMKWARGRYQTDGVQTSLADSQEYKLFTDDWPARIVRALARPSADAPTSITGANSPCQTLRVGRCNPLARYSHQSIPTTSV